MLFKDYIKTLSKIKNYLIEIELSSWEKILIENIPWKQASLQLLQNHLWDKKETKTKFNLKNFCEHYDEWRNNPDWHHKTINFLYKYNKEGWVIKRI